MPKYLFTSDQRISALPERIQWVADFINSGHNVSEIDDKSDNNNAATLKFYYNLHSGTETCEKAVEDPVFAIRNFVLKFQFPNVRTQESLQNTVNERLLLAPYRSVVSLLVALADITKCDTSTMSMGEILYYVFCNPAVYNNPAVNYKEIAKQILNSREKNEDFENAVVDLLEWNQYERQSRELINVLTYSSKCFSFSKGILKYSTTHEDYIIDKDFIDELITYNKFWYPSDSQDFNLATLEYISYMNTVNAPYNIVEFTPNTTHIPFASNKYPLQQIYYGAPGTGKSHATNEVTSKYPDTVRTTFHPDSDYSTFVGAYKPTMTKVRKAVVIGQDEKEVKPLDCNSEWEEKIAYKFVKQAFLKAYVKAWKLFKETCVDGGELAPQFLVIEEINRGNCAQIFGDLFQLLDRKQNLSEYPIEADADICKALLEENTEDNPSFGAEGLQLTENQKTYINNVYDGKPIAEKICTGQVLVLPPNLYIWATMNTSDQSLFPIDSAFKRRWEWKYMKIKEGKDKDGNKLDWKIVVKDKDGGIVKIKDEDSLSWWAFIQKINTIIASMTSSADKQLGYFFCKADNGVISGETFVSKVIFYLWNDVFKDYGFEDASLFRYEVKEGEKVEEKDLTFPDFYDEDGENVNAERLVDFIQKVMDWQKTEENV